MLRKQNSEGSFTAGDWQDRRFTLGGPHLTLTLILTLILILTLPLTLILTLGGAYLTYEEVGAGGEATPRAIAIYVYRY